MKKKFQNLKQINKGYITTSSYSSSYSSKYKKKSSKLSNVFGQANNQKAIRQTILDKEFTQVINSLSRQSSIQKRKSIEKDMWIGADLNSYEKRSQRSFISSIKGSQMHIANGRRQDQRQRNRDDSPNSLNIRSNNTSPKLKKQHSDILIEEEIQEDLNIYQQYRQLQSQYLRELELIKEETQKIRKQCELERVRIAQSQQTLIYKRKKLKSLQDSYQQIIDKNNTQAEQQTNLINKLQQKLQTLRDQYEDLKKKNADQKTKLQKQYDDANRQNQNLKKQLENLQKELSLYEKQLSQEQYTQKMAQLSTQQQTMLKQIKHLQTEQENLKKQLSRIQQSKPVSSEVHKKYLQLYQKMFITSQLQKAQEILQMKDNQRHQIQEFEKRKNWVKQKKIEVALREKRLNQKNKMIDKLTQEIREKSTTLLNLYQQQA